MNLLDFIARFPEENDCLGYFLTIRQKTGVVCSKCGNNTHKWLTGFDQFECEKCSNHINIKSGTVMYKSKLPVKYWFIAIHLLTSETETYNISEIHEKLGCTDVDQVREMLGILTRLMGKTENGCSFDQLLVACMKP